MRSFGMRRQQIVCRVFRFGEQAREGVCTENLIRVDEVAESLKLAQ
jgi:hypothetical protein